MAGLTVKAISDLRYAANRAIESAIDQDRSKRWNVAVEHYSEGIDLFKALMRLEMEHSQKKVISENVERYQQRLDRLRRFIEDELANEPSRVGTPVSLWETHRRNTTHSRVWTAGPRPALSLETDSLARGQRRYSFGTFSRSPREQPDFRLNFSRSPPSCPHGDFPRSPIRLGSQDDFPAPPPYRSQEPFEPFPFSPTRDSGGDFGFSPQQNGILRGRKVDKDIEGMTKQIQNTVLCEKPNVHWDDIAGLAEAKQALKEAVVLPLQLPHLFYGKRAPWRGILLYGPPGTGKSYLAKAVATEAEATFFSISSSDLVSKWLGESEKLIKHLFKMAREQKPAIIFIDELDSICAKRTEGENEGTRRIKTEILVQMQGVGQDQDGVLVLGATNLPSQLDAAVLRRFEQRVYIGLPEASARKRLFQLETGLSSAALHDVDLDRLADMTDGYSGSDINQICKKANMMPIRCIMKATHFKRVKDGHLPADQDEPGAFPAKWTDLDRSSILDPALSMTMLVDAIHNTKKTVSTRDMLQYREWVQETREDRDVEA